MLNATFYFVDLSRTVTGGITPPWIFGYKTVSFVIVSLYYFGSDFITGFLTTFSKVFIAGVFIIAVGFCHPCV